MTTRRTLTRLAPLMILGLALSAAACGGGQETTTGQQPVIGQPTQSECLGELDGDGVTSENVELLVEGDRLRIVDHYAEFNCCLEAWMEVSISDDHIVVVEKEDPDDTMACDCVCPFELAIEVSNLAAGDYRVSVYRHAIQDANLIHDQTVCVGDACEEPPECQAASDCLDKDWLIDCLGHWVCEAGTCSEMCDFEACGDGTCDAELGESAQSCPNDCNVLPECEAASDCLDKDWLIDCLGHWTCEQGTCSEMCDFEACGDGTCDAELGESEQSCPNDCPGSPVPELTSFQAACGDCGTQECYEPDPPHFESRLTYEVEPTDDGFFSLRAAHQVLCIDVGILGADLVVEGNTLILIEDFDHENPVDCYCNQTADILISGLTPGAWELAIYNDDREHLMVQQAFTVTR